MKLFDKNSFLYISIDDEDDIVDNDDDILSYHTQSSHCQTGTHIIRVLKNWTLTSIELCTMNLFTFPLVSVAPPEPKIGHDHPVAPDPPPKRTKHLSLEKNEDVYVNNIEFKIPNKKGGASVKIRDTIATYFVNMKQVDPTIAILLLKDATLSTILNSVLLPSEAEYYDKYFTTPTFDCRFTKVYFTSKPPSTSTTSSTHLSSNLS